MTPFEWIRIAHDENSSALLEITQSLAYHQHFCNTTQILATVSNIFQILGVLWILLFGSRTVFEALKIKAASSRPAPPITTSNTSSYKKWKWTGIFILFIASVAWVAFKANVLQIGLLWYEVLIIGLTPSGIWIAIMDDEATPSLIVGFLCLGPLIAVATYFIIYPFHLSTLLCALITFIAALVLIRVYLIIFFWVTEK